MSTPKQPKRRIKQNVWGNWNGYEGAKKVREFGTQEGDAREWAAGVEPMQRPKVIKFMGHNFVEA